ncbi:ribosome recycling factor [Pseudenhygromyxa sp. WMMC2535]|uniref:ribosome recycling factor n=1 Tax=Pseudenhygromyxa sp. WMMC2535 TaxID=2712867 RepID=UPI0015518F51|nr:ribosome recycling factor [Pseudenhygromyxa sp. WMMC2535]NVB40012.1 ribosome recycling factor [Pseudenhygromyxa sp. WMMC2535]
MIDDALELAQDAMDKASQRLAQELARVRAGRANPALLDGVRVEAYGAQMNLNQVATVSTADARLLIVKPFDANSIGSIEKAILNADLGLNPSSDGVIIRVPIPPLTEERRRNLVKQVKDLAEDTKIAIRQGRRDANDLLKEAEKDKDISEDQLKRGLEKVQDLTNKFVATVDEAVKKKEAEIMDD